MKILRRTISIKKTEWIKINKDLSLQFTADLTEDKELESMPIIIRENNP